MIPEKKSKVENKKAQKDLEVANTRLDNLQLLLVDNKIEIHEYNKLKAKFTSEIQSLKKFVSNNTDKPKEIFDGLKESINLFNNLPKAMAAMDIADKHEILRSIFPEKLKFDGKNCRTEKSNRVLDLLLTVDTGSGGNKKRDKLKNLGLSLRVDPQGVEPWSK